MRWKLLASFSLVVALNVAPALAVMPDEMLKDPAQEARARELSAGFRCLVCQNQSIDDSDAELARDLRILIRERISQGDSDAAVKDFVVSRYGDYVLLKPRLTSTTLALWLLPFAALAGGLAFLLRRRRPQPALAEQPLTGEEQERLERL
jgi:cytochrome c-type biogenesis protein CcmH